jgi:heat shock protein HslJ
MVNRSIEFRRFMSAIVLLFIAVAGCNQGSSNDSSTPQAPEALFVGPKIDIVNVTWQLTEVGGEAVPPAGVGMRPPTLHLNPVGNTVNGYSGLNQFHGSYELNGDKLKFQPMAMTRRGGPGPAMALESAFSDALNKTQAWRAKDNDTIEFTGSWGKTLARFTRSATP